jgi:hypothetical protein
MIFRPFIYILSFFFVSIQLPTLSSANDPDNLISRFFRPNPERFSAGAIKKLAALGSNDFNRDDGGFDDESVPIMELQYYGSWNSTAEQSTRVY